MSARLDLSETPVIAAVKNETQLTHALQSECEVIFLLFGNILNVAHLTEQIAAAGKHAIVHLDLINGLSSREIAVDFIAETTKAEGIISTKPMLIRRAKELGLFTVLRIFVIDSKALSNLSKEQELAEPDVLEILPGLMPGVLRKICRSVTIPVVAGGLLCEKRDILAALSAGAVAVSTTDEKSWEF